jgi:hypothetical protein
MSLSDLDEPVREFAISSSQLPSKVSRSLETSNEKTAQAKHNLMKRGKQT